MAGHRVRIVTLDGFEELVRGCGLDHLSIGRSPREIAASQAGREWVERRASTTGFLQGFVRVAASLIEAGVTSYWGLCQDVEALVVSGMGLLVGIHIAERLRIPLIRVQLSPFARTHYDWSGHKTLLTTVRGEWTAFLHAAFRLLIWSKLRTTANNARQKVLYLPPLSLRDPFRAMDRKRVLVLDAYSPAVVPRPPDWGDWVQVTGYWFLEDPPGWTPPEGLLDFLRAGPRPVFVGFGSTPFPDPEATTSLILRSLARTRQRGVVLAGGSGLPKGRLSDEVISLDSVPHRWLFSQVSAAVHHGGAGVTGAALYAGLPSVVVPVFADQPFWGERVFSLGAGPRPIPAKHLTEDALAGAIQSTASREIRARASALGDQIRSEKGVWQAVKIIHAHLGCGNLKDATYRHVG
jgi:UDP:flavonoid glycosyltransferase YjiC (YdhE family)